MLPYKYLSFLLKYKNNFNTYDLAALWDYNTIFPTTLQKKMRGGNKNAYWLKINAETDINKIKKELIKYKTTAETGTLTDLISRINNFRL